MKVIDLLASLLLVLNLSCASTQNVVFDYNLDIDFNQYSTYVLCIDDLFVEHTTQPNLDNKLIRNHLANAIDYEMKRRHHQTNVLNPQLQVGFIITLNETSTTFTDYNTDNPLNYWQECKIKEKTFQKETLITYVANYKTNEIIWQASLDCNLNKPKGALKNHINELIKQLFDTYPKTAQLSL